MNNMTQRQKIDMMRKGKFGKAIVAAETEVDRFALVLVDQFAYTPAQIRKLIISACGGEIDLENTKHRELAIVTMKELVQLECISRFNGQMDDLGNKNQTPPAVTINQFSPVELLLDGESSSFITQDEVELVKSFNKEVERYV